MSVGYVAVQWNRHKRIYDAFIAGFVLLYVGLFVAVTQLLRPPPHQIDPMVTLIRAFGTCAIVLLHVVLCIGPAARLDRRFLPILYNRRHLGVATFLVALVHAGLVTLYYYGFGVINPLEALLTINPNYTSLTAFPFEVLGAAALVILLVLAAISHDFWQRNLGATAWKTIHMLIYPAYGLVILHVALGVLQSEHAALYIALLAVGVALVTGLHIAAGLREVARDRGSAAMPADDEGWVDVAAVSELEQDKGRVVCIPEHERIALFRHAGGISAVTNLCAHQRGPLGEGRIIDGCITCPWHGWQYRPEDGQSPPPFTEKVETYRVKVQGDRVLIHPDPPPPGTPVEPAAIPSDTKIEAATDV